MKTLVLWMREHKKLVMLAVLALTLFVTSCQSASATERVEEVRGGGVAAWLMRDTSLPMVVMEITFRGAGARSDTVGKEGRAAFTSELLTEGAGKYTSAAFHELLEQHAIQLSVSSTRDDIVVSVAVLREHLPQAFALIGDMLRAPRFDQTEIDRARVEYLSGLKQLQESPEYRLNEAFDAAAFAGHPYARSAYGTASSVQALTRADLQAFVPVNLTKDRMIMSVSGDTDAVALARLMETHLSGLPAKGDASRTDPIALKTLEKPLTVQMDVPQTEVRVALAGIARKNPQFYAAFVMNYLLGGGSLTSRLADEIRKKRGLTYSISSSLAMQDNAEWVSVDFATKAKSADDAVKFTLETLQRTAEQGFTAAELKAAQDYLIGSFALGTDSNAERVHYLTVMQQYDLGQDYLEKRNTLIANVTLPEVNAIAKKLLNTQKRLIIFTGNHP
jgi:zinc protease